MRALCICFVAVAALVRCVCSGIRFRPYLSAANHQVSSGLTDHANTNTNALGNPALREQLSKNIEWLHDMGFRDDNEIIHALSIAQGDINGAVHVLLSRRENSGSLRNQEDSRQHSIEESQTIGMTSIGPNGDSSVPISVPPENRFLGPTLNPNAETLFSSNLIPAPERHHQPRRRYLSDSSSEISESSSNTPGTEPGLFQSAWQFIQRCSDRLSQRSVKIYLGTITMVPCVGVRHYQTGLFQRTGDRIVLQRDPENSNDADAIKVLSSVGGQNNEHGHQIGWVSSTSGHAACLSPILDHKLTDNAGADVVAQVGEEASSLSATKIHLNVHLFGYVHDRAYLESYLASYGHVLNSIDVLNGKSMSESLSILGNSQATSFQVDNDRNLADQYVHLKPKYQLTHEEAEVVMEEMFDQLTESQIKDLVESPLHIPGLKTDLKPHQTAGVRWMIRRERRDPHDFRDPSETSLVTTTKINEDMELDSENNCTDTNALPDFWEYEEPSGLFVNSITAHSQKRRPRHPKGGLLADEMGLGKTIQALSLILSDRGTAQRARLLEQNRRGQYGGGNSRLDPINKEELLGRITENTTIVICPTAAIFHWEEEIRKHIDNQLLNVLVYYGPSRKMKAYKAISNLIASRCLSPSGANLNLNLNLDIVLTTYPTMVSDLLPKTRNTTDNKESRHDGNANEDEHGFNDCEGDRTSKLKRVKMKTKKQTGLEKWGPEAVRRLFFNSKGFRRILLDEAHVLRNQKSRSFQAIKTINSTYTWCLTGTPLVNSPKDIEALLILLKVEPFDAKRLWWDRAIGQALKQGDNVGLVRLRTLLRSIGLRRNKTILNRYISSQLPEKIVHIAEITLNDNERRVYDAVIHHMTKWFGGIYDNGGEDAVLRQYTQILGGLTRLKQICCDHRLVPVAHLAQLLSDGLSTQERAELLVKLESIFKSGSKALYKDGEDMMCLVCFDPILRENARITKCGHLFCSKCLGHILSDVEIGPKCPMCRSPLKRKECIAAPSQPINVTHLKSNPHHDIIGDESIPSSKEALLLCRLNEIRSSGAKSVVISQFTSFLDRIQKHLVQNGMQVARVDGRCDPYHRARQIQRFSANDPDAPTVMLLSLRAGGVAIDLTSANHVFLMDQWWNPAVDNQAIDRVHRIGQSRQVHVWKFVVKDSIEEKIVQLQQVKQALTVGVHSRLSAEDLRQTRVKALLNIFGRA